MAISDLHVRMPLQKSCICAAHMQYTCPHVQVVHEQHYLHMCCTYVYTQHASIWTPSLALILHTCYSDLCSCLCGCVRVGVCACRCVCVGAYVHSSMISPFFIPTESEGTSTRLLPPTVPIPLCFSSYDAPSTSL